MHLTKHSSWRRNPSININHPFIVIIIHYHSYIKSLSKLQLQFRVHAHNARNELIPLLLPQGAKGQMSNRKPGLLTPPERSSGFAWPQFTPNASVLLNCMACQFQVRTVLAIASSPMQTFLKPFFKMIILKELVSKRPREKGYQRAELGWQGARRGRPWSLWFSSVLMLGPSV